MTPLPAPERKLQMCSVHQSGASQRPAVRFITGPQGRRTFYCSECGPQTAEGWTRMEYLGAPAEIEAAYRASQAPVVKAAAEIVTRPPILAELTPAADQEEAEAVIEAEATREVLSLLDKTRRAVVTVMQSQPLAKLEQVTRELNRVGFERDRLEKELREARLNADGYEARWTETLHRDSRLTEDNEELTRKLAEAARRIAEQDVTISELRFDLEEATRVAFEAIDGLPSAQIDPDAAGSEPAATPEPSAPKAAPRARVKAEPDEPAAESALALALLDLPKPLGGPKVGIEGSAARKSYKLLDPQDRARALTQLKRIAEEGLAHPALRVTHILQHDVYSVRASHRLRVMLRKVTGGYEIVEFVDRADRRWYASE